jgi:CheY-like chemotaxis protein
MCMQLGGREAAAQLRQYDSRVPIIFLTGETAASMRKCAQQFAPSALLLKPCSRLELIAVSGFNLYAD